MTHATHGGRRNRGWGESREENQPFTFHLPKIGPIFSVVLWAVLGVGIVFLLRAIFSRAFGRPDTSDRRETRTDASAAESASQKSAVEIDVLRLLINRNPAPAVVEAPVTEQPAMADFPPTMTPA
jgi:hypothetical protein